MIEFKDGKVEIVIFSSSSEDGYGRHWYSLSVNGKLKYSGHRQTKSAAQQACIQALRDLVEPVNKALGD